MKTKTEFKAISKGRSLAWIPVFILVILFSSYGYGQSVPLVAVSHIDTRGMPLSPDAMGNLVRLELEKTGTYRIVDRYDMHDLLKMVDMDITGCYGKSCLVEIGKVLQVDKILTGTAEQLGDKIVITLRLINVESEIIENTDVTEYQNIPEELQIMTGISVNNILGIANDPYTVELLVNFEEPITSKYASQRLNGPRMGVAYVTGDLAKSLVAPKDQGGYGGYPVLSQFGYQSELQYLSAGNFSALIEFLVMISGMEQGLFIPSVVFMNGFRVGKGNWEIAFGPSINLRKTGTGFYDTYGELGDPNDWHLEADWHMFDPENPNPYDVVERYDSRGETGINTGWVWALGRTFHSGPLNVPFNIYCSPQKSGWFIGASVGFNINRKRKGK